QEQSLWAVARVINALTGQEISSETGEFVLDPDEFIGCKAIAHVSVDDSYDGTPRNQIDSLSSVLTGAKK
ncbi:hypothetical protein LCGC14_2716460, partial [marine sediment metagenome]